jgi:photosystem II stability/assembly factor-like uncharacterized protein
VKEKVVILTRTRVSFAILSLIFTLLVTAGAPLPVNAQELSPEGSAVSIAVDANDGSLLKIDAGLFRSSDDGGSWTPVPLPGGLDPATLRWVATTAAAPDSVYLAGPGAGIRRSDDRGTTWRTVSDGLPSQAVGAFAVHTFRPDTLYVWIAEQGVFRTEDSGGSWTLMDEGPASRVSALAHSTYEGSMNTGWLYAATPEGPYLSMDCF